MVTINFVILCGVGIIACVLHSYFKRGGALTLNFFLFSFMLTFTRGGVHIFKFINSSGPSSIIVKAALSTLIWVLAFYLSVYIAEKVADRSTQIKHRIFPVLLFAGITISAIAYAFETTATNIGWWAIPVTDVDSGFLLTPFYVIRKWFYFYVYFLAAYFLIACSEYKRKNWKTIFFILPFVHAWIPRFFGEGLPQIIEEHAALMVLLVLAFTNPLRFDYSGIKKHEGVSFLKPKLLDQLPMAVMIMLLSTLALLDVAKIHDAGLVISILPAMFFILLAIKRIPFYWIASLALISLLLLKKLALPIIVPVGFLIIFCSIVKTRAKTTNIPLK